MKDKLLARIASLESARDEFVANANLKVAYFNGAIAELQRLIKEDEHADQGSTETPEAV